MIRLAEAAFGGLSLQTIYRQARAGKLHLTEDSDGLSSVCLNSLPRIDLPRRDRELPHTDPPLGGTNQLPAAGRHLLPAAPSLTGRRQQ